MVIVLMAVSLVRRHPRYGSSMQTVARSAPTVRLCGASSAPHGLLGRVYDDKQAQRVRREVGSEPPAV